MSNEYDLGVADALNEYGMFKEAADAYLTIYTQNNPMSKVAMEGGQNPFDGMSDEEILQLIQQLPAGVQQEILAQIQGAAGAAPAPQGV